MIEMNVARRGLASALALFLGAAFAGSRPAAAAPDSHCSHDTLAIDGPVTVTLCATKTDPKSIAVAETFAGKNGTFIHATTIDVFPGEESSRGIDDVPLGALGSSKTVHLTMHVKAGIITLEHALLLPGAVPLK